MPLPRNEGPTPRDLSSSEKDEWLKAARQRVPPSIQTLDNFVKEMGGRYPWRAARFRQDLKWWIKQAEKRGIEW